ncbi:BatA domain-containing protein [Lentisphaerota bacterium WC36G]|nr:BatA domain-containing protein [Lentisphaerae bacterium WC36]
MIQLAYSIFLGGLTLLTIPIILHLLKNKPSQPIPFASLQFLTSSIIKSQKKNRLKKRLVLLLRMLTITSICFAFAWPYIGKFSNEVQSAKVILWDGSYSMQADNYNQFLYKSAIKNLGAVNYQNPAMIGIVTDNVKWNGSFSSNKLTLQRWFETNYQGNFTSDFSFALAQAEAKLKTINCKNKKIVVITDHQKIPWEKVNYDKLLEDGIKLELVTPEDDMIPFKNCYIEGLSCVSAFVKSGQDLVIDVKVANLNDSNNSGVITVKADNYKEVSQRFKIPKKSTHSYQVVLKPLGKNRELKPLSCSASIEMYSDDDIGVDNKRYCWIKPVSMGKIKISETTSNQFNYIKTAFSPQVNSLKEEKKIIFDGRQKTNLEKVDLLVLQDLRLLHSSYIQQVKKYLKRGGNIAVVGKNDEETKKFLNFFNIKISDEINKTTQLSFIDYDHKIFSPYTKIKSDEWYTINFFNHLKVSHPKNGKILAEFLDGDPAIIELDYYGKGKIFLITFELNRETTDWMTKTVFLPFWREFLSYAHDLIKVNKVAQNEIDCSNVPVLVSNNVKIFNSKNEEQKLAPVKNIFGEVKNNKQYQFIPQVSNCYYHKDNNETFDYFVVNPSIKESKNAIINKTLVKKIKGIARNADMPVKNSRESTQELVAKREKNSDKHNSYPIWRILLIIALAAMVLEILIANRTAL